MELIISLFCIWGEVGEGMGCDVWDGVRMGGIDWS